MIKEEFNPKPSRLLVPTTNEWPAGLRHYVPLKTRDPDLRRWLHGKPRGVRTIYDEARALSLLKGMLKSASSPEEAGEIGRMGALGFFGSSSYLSDELVAVSPKIAVPKVQNKYRAVPRLATPDPANRPGAEELRDRALALLEPAISLANHRLAAKCIGSSAAQGAEILRETGSAISRFAEACAVIELGELASDPTNGISDIGLQLLSREACMSAMRDRHTISVETGNHVSAIQVVEGVSPYAVEFQKAASDSVYDIYQDALAA